MVATTMLIVPTTEVTITASGDELEDGWKQEEVARVQLFAGMMLCEKSIIR